MFLFYLTLKSYRLRKVTVSLLLLSIALSVSLFLGIQIIRKEVKNKFSNAISQTDLIVGSRTGDINLLLYSVFHIGNATNNIKFQTYEYFKNHNFVKWAIPISLGDSHKGFRVIGTNASFFEHYKYNEDKAVFFNKGSYSELLFTVTIGADVAKKLNYSIHQKIKLSHGVSEHSIFDHDDKEFIITGILSKTYTPLDQALFVSLNSIEAIHADWLHGVPPDESEVIPLEQIHKMKLNPKNITAFYLGLNTPTDILLLKRDINTYIKEPLTSIIPATTLNILWQQVGYAESALGAISILTALISFISVFIAIYNSLQERRREISILRALGTNRSHIFALYLTDSFVLTFLGSFLGVVFTYLILLFANESLSKLLNIAFEFKSFLGFSELMYLFYFNLIGILVGVIPAYKAYWYSIHDGLSIKV